MATYKVGDAVTLLGVAVISNVCTNLSMRDPSIIQKAVIKAGLSGIITQTSGSPIYACKVMFTDLTLAWCDVLWIQPYSNAGNNVGNALKAQRKLNEEQGIDKVPTACNCSSRDLWTFGHKCGRKAPIDRR